LRRSVPEEPAQRKSRGLGRRDGLRRPRRSAGPPVCDVRAEAPGRRSATSAPKGRAAGLRRPRRRAGPPVCDVRSGYPAHRAPGHGRRAAGLPHDHPGHSRAGVSQEWGALRMRGGSAPGADRSRRAALPALIAPGGQLSRRGALCGADADPMEKPASSTFSSSTAVRGRARRARPSAGSVAAGKTGKGRFPMGRPLLSRLHQPRVACPHAAHRASGGAAPAAAAWSSDSRGRPCGCSPPPA